MYRITEVYNNQLWLIQRMSQLFSNCSQAGICFGIAAMRMQAILSGDSELFDFRLKMIHDIPLENFKDEIETINQKRLEITKHVKEENGHYRELNEKEKNLLLEDETLLSKLYKVEETVMSLIKGGKITASSQKQEVERRKNLCYFDALIQYKINEKISDLTKDEQIKLDILPFLNGVQLYQQDRLYPDLYENHKSPSSDRIIHNYPLVSPISIELKGGICKLHEFSNAYTEEELVLFFTSFAEIAKKNQIKGSLAFVLQSIYHAITVEFNSTRNEWSFTDATYLPSAYTDDTVLLAKEVHHALSKNYTAIFLTEIFTDKQSENSWKEILAFWKMDERMKKIQQITPPKTLKTDSYGASLLSLAAAMGDIVLTQAILKAENAIPKKDRLIIADCPALCMAAQNNHNDVVKLLLENGENPNAQRQSDEATALIIAVANANIEIISILLGQGAKPNEITKKGHTALHISVLANDIKVMQLLLNQGADCQICSNDGMSPLYLAVRVNNIEMVKMLLDYGAQPNAPTISNSELLMAYAKKENIQSQMEQFIKRKITEPPASLSLEMTLYFINNNIYEPYLSITPIELATLLDFDEIVNLLEGANHSRHTL